MEKTTTSPLTIALTWLVVLIPLVWAIWQTSIKVIELFK